MATSVAGEGQPSLNGIISEPQTKRLTDLPTELLEHILCFPVLKHVDICNVSCCCKRLHDVCHGRGKVWGHQYKLRCYDFFVRYFFGVLASGGFSPLSTTTSLPVHMLFVLFGALNRSFVFSKVVSSIADSQAAVSRWHSADAPNSSSRQASGRLLLCRPLWRMQISAFKYFTSCILLSMLPPRTAKNELVWPWMLHVACEVQESAALAKVWALLLADLADALLIAVVCAKTKSCLQQDGKLLRWRVTSDNQMLN